MLVASRGFCSIESDRRVASWNSPAIVVSHGYFSTMDQQHHHQECKAEPGSCALCSVSLPPADTALCRTHGSSLILPLHAVTRSVNPRAGTGTILSGPGALLTPLVV